MARSRPAFGEALAFADQWEMFPKDGGKILCAVSGGGDSMCLLHWLKSLAEEGRGFTVAAAHYNHHLRGAQSDAEEAFVRRWCAENELALFCGGGDVAAAAKKNGWSEEEAARRLRYAFLRETASACGATKIATAHNAEDNAETILMHLVRGTGLAGMGGIPPVRGLLIRPFLQTRHRALLAYLDARGIPHAEDASNEDLRLARNRFRHEILPALQRENPNLVETLGRQAELLRREDAFLDSLAEQRLCGAEVTENGVRLPRKALQTAPPTLRNRMLRLLLDRLPVGKADYTAVHIESLARLGVDGKQNGRLPLPKSVLASNSGNFLQLEIVGNTAKNVAILPSKIAFWGDFSIFCAISSKNDPSKMYNIRLNLDNIHSPLSVGSWRAGDWMTLQGAKGARSLKRLFSERGIRSPRREQTPVLYVGDELAAVCGIGISAAFAPTEGCQTLMIAIGRREPTAAEDGACAPGAGERAARTDGRKREGKGSFK